MGIGDSIPRGGDDLVVSLGQDDEAFWRDIADRGVVALEALEPGGPNFWTVVQALAPWAAFLAAAVVAVVALRINEKFSPRPMPMSPVPNGGGEPNGRWKPAHLGTLQ